MAPPPRLAVHSSQLGAQPVRPIDLAAFFAAIANEGMHPVPYAVELIDRDGERIYHSIYWRWEMESGEL